VTSTVMSSPISLIIWGDAIRVAVKSGFRRKRTGHYA
jgi:hypothetical protein